MEELKEIVIDDVYVTPLIRAARVLERFRKNNKTEQEKAGIIQAFEFCYELSWKTMKRLLEKRGVIVSSPRETFRKAAVEGLIEDPEVWFTFLQKRNIMSHVYNQEDADSVLLICPAFSDEVKKFLRTIGAPYD